MRGRENKLGNVNSISLICNELNSSGSQLFTIVVMTNEFFLEIPSLLPRRSGEGFFCFDQILDGLIRESK